jgi:murein L,D-transpeptidase YafK
MACETTLKPKPDIKEEQFISCWPNSNQIPVPEHYSPDQGRLVAEDLIVIHKAERRLIHYKKGKITLDKDGLNCWRVGLGAQPEGPKEKKGDQRTPEGWYASSDRPTSKYFGAINIHYPNSIDAKNAFSKGVISEAEKDDIVRAEKKDIMPYGETPLGGLILIHGSGKNWPINPIGSKLDWTEGCVMMDDDDLSELRALLPSSMKTDVLILP